LAVSIKQASRLETLRKVVDTTTGVENCGFSAFSDLGNIIEDKSDKKQILMTDLLRGKKMY
jgi:hypothetical protein